ncbi:putative bifunctional diguanylate cyclase/phosphodiesterase [Desulfovirgula thermocuniculi]|uniref:putative bifunctional diguanylate cyclase/phosphodiesterase n=1 Tax=Desulfovirgula thermocuniculi TaxID=348842 RepID=UPI0004812C4B|nr:GGDEF and EAL domain-containing protein [Desulfovirgula thermocuniculi]
MLTEKALASLLKILQEQPPLLPEAEHKQLEHLLARIKGALGDLPRLACYCQEAFQKGQALYGQERTVEEVLGALVSIGNLFLRETLQRASFPSQPQELQALFMAALLELGCLYLGYQEESLKSLRLLTEVDPLTGLLNREPFQKELDRALEYARRQNESLSIVWVDVDNLRFINDIYGYVVGDAVLRAVAGTIKEIFSSPEMVTSRTGSNSFGVICPARDLREALSLAEQLRQEVERQRPVEEDLGVTVSVGVSSFPLHGSSANDLLTAAEMAGIMAKRRGKNRVEVLEVSKGQAELTQKHEKSVLLKEALLHDDGIIPYFQPIVDTTTGSTVGFEVLARISLQGQLYPAAFFAELAEDTNLIHQVTIRCLEKALAKFSQRSAEHLIFINCALQEVEQEDVVNKFLGLLRRYHLRPERLVVELTERQAVRDIGKVLAFALELQNAGIRLALDDFGSGFSSFLYLRYFDCYFVKIEGSLVRDLTRSSRCKLIVEQMVALLRKLGIEPIAEWVETAETCEALKRLGVTLCQGYHLGKPSPEISA